MKTLIKELCSLEGVSGREYAVREFIKTKLKESPAVTGITVDPLGNILANVTGKSRAKQKLMFAAHMDEVGFIITGVTDEGFLRFAGVGGIDQSVVYGRRVIVNGHTGVIGGKAVHQLKGDDKKKSVPLDKLLIDVGADSKEEALKIAGPGDVAVFESEYREIGSLIKARALDDRAGCALLLKLAEATPEYDITLAFTVQEEVGLRGAKTAAYGISPDVAVVVDSTTAADTAGVSEQKQVCCVGKGPVVSFMDNRTLYDRNLFGLVLDTAKSINVKSQVKSAVAGGNDAGAIHLTKCGVKVAAVSLPCRYLHSASCMISMEDAEETFKLLNELIGVIASKEEIN
ncbi:MAG TPA: M42 family metallopeptidase [Clostridiales bacterium]|nr:M42 family metallopeptidase [Clostridiales bacterium]